MKRTRPITHNNRVSVQKCLVAMHRVDDLDDMIPQLRGSLLHIAIDSQNGCSKGGVGQVISG